MSRRYCFTGIASLLLAFAGGDALAQSQVTLTPSMDNTLYEESGSLSNGAGDFLFAGNTNTGNARRALIAFDVADALPEEVQVDSVELSLQVSNAPPGAASTQFDIHRLSRTWGESTSDAGNPGGTGTAAASGDATWTHAFHDSETWQTEGGDFDSAASATLSAGGAGQRYTVGSSGVLAADVQSWLDDPSSNFGWILVGDEATTQTARRFDSGDHPTESNRPQLTIYYSTTTAAENPDVPGSFVLQSNYPNPFSRATVIRYELDRTQEVALEVYDVTGRPVKTVSRGVQVAGPHEIELDGRKMASGLYIYCLIASSSRECRTFTVLR